MTNENFKQNSENIIVESTEELEIRNILSSDYWKFVYTAECAHKNYSDLINMCRNSFEILSKYIDDEYYTLRCIINASLCKINSQKSAYSLTNLSSDEARAAVDLLLFSCKFGYYFGDIYDKCGSDDILDFFIKHNSMPIPPLPFNSNDEQRARIATYKMAVGTIFAGRESFKEEMKNTKFTYSIESEFGDKSFGKKIKRTNFRQKVTEISIEQIFDGEPRQVHELAEIIKMRKCIVTDSYYSGSIPARCIGLIMYNAMTSSEEPYDDVVNRFKSTVQYEKINNIRLFKNSGNAYISDKDNSILKRWLKATHKCVEKMSVLDFS